MSVVRDRLIPNCRLESGQEQVLLSYEGPRQFEPRIALCNFP